jgi:predicted DNA-binding transcriptional regulator AlpA
MRAPEAAKFLALAESTLAKMRLRGDGPSFVKAGPRAVTYRKIDLESWLEARVRRSTADTPPTAA